jgi:hypothetical protein
MKEGKSFYGEHPEKPGKTKPIVLLFYASV